MQIFVMCRRSPSPYRERRSSPEYKAYKVKDRSYPRDNYKGDTDRYRRYNGHLLAFFCVSHTSPIAAQASASWILTQ